MLGRYASVLLLSFLAGLASDVYVLVLSNQSWLAAVAVTLALPYLNFLFNHYWVEEHRVLYRLYLVTASAVGGALGVLAVALLWSVL